MTQLDPRDHIDRNAEQELFRDLVTYRTPARILTICDRGGWGKSSLLKRLKYNCEYEIRVPSCLLELDKLDDPSTFAFVSALARGFTSLGEDVGTRFESFKRLDDARTARDFGPFDDGARLVRREGRYMGHSEVATMHGGESIGLKQVVQHADTVLLPTAADLTDDQEQRARERCIAAFFDDLRSICAIEPMVVLLDGWEKCVGSLRDFISRELLGGHMLARDRARRPDKLALVIAGRPYEAGTSNDGLRHDELRPFFDSEDDFKATVKSIASLSEWGTEHVRAFMVLNGCREPTEEDVNFIRARLATNWPLEKVMSIIDEHLKD